LKAFRNLRYKPVPCSQSCNDDNTQHFNGKSVTVWDVKSEVKYDDGDEEEVELEELLRMLQPETREITPNEAAMQRQNWLLSDEGQTIDFADSLALRKEMRRTNVVIFDTTHGTNRYGLKLGLFVTVGSDLRTKIIALSLVSSEDIPSFQWVFQKFIRHFKLPPTVVFTDSDAAMKAAIED